MNFRNESRHFSHPLAEKDFCHIRHKGLVNTGFLEVVSAVCLSLKKSISLLYCITKATTRLVAQIVPGHSIDPEQEFCAKI